MKLRKVTEIEQCNKLEHCKKNKNNKEWQYRKPACICKEIYNLLNIAFFK